MAFVAAWMHDHSGNWAPLYCSISPIPFPVTQNSQGEQGGKQQSLASCLTLFHASAKY